MFACTTLGIAREEGSRLWTGEGFDRQPPSDALRELMNMPSHVRWEEAPRGAFNRLVSRGQVAIDLRKRLLLL